MKRIMTLVLAMVLVSGFFMVSNAGSAVTERPDIKITIDGVTSSYANTPILVNGRTLLPLRELLTNLGVPNDDQHIVWNGKENSVTAVKDSSQIYLKVGSANAKIDGRSATLDASPVNYKGRVYIPARFAAEAFHKVVAWDSVTKRIYIRDAANYNEVKAILDKTLALMDGAKGYKVNINDKTTYTDAVNGTIDASDVSDSYVSKENKISYYTSDDSDFGKYEAYTVDHRYYNKFSKDPQWKRTILTEEDFNGYLNDYDPRNLINPRDVIYSALSVEKDPGKNRTYLRGDVYLLTKSAENMPNSQSDIDQYSDTYLEIEIDDTTGYISRINEKAKLQRSPEGEEPYLADHDYTYNFSEMNGNFTIDLPQYITDDIKKDPNPAVPVEIVLSDTERKTVNQLKQSSNMVAVDGLYSNPYNLDVKEAILFIILKDQTAFESYNSLSDNAKIVFSNETAQDNMGEYLGCSKIHSIIMFDGKAYSEIITDYGTLSSSLNLLKYDGISKQIVVQDKEQNTYQDYKN